MSQIHGHVHILEQSVSVGTQLRYFRFSELIRKRNDPPRPLTDEMCLDLYGMLYDPLRTEHEKKYALLMLATSKNVKAFRLLQEFVENDPDIESICIYKIKSECVNRDTYISYRKGNYFTFAMKKFLEMILNR